MAMNDTRTTMSSTLPARTAATGLNAIDWIAMVLMIVGGINWGLVGLLNFDLVAAIFGTMTVISRTVYTLVGLSALYGIVLLLKLGSADRSA